MGVRPLTGSSVQTGDNIVPKIFSIPGAFKLHLRYFRIRAGAITAKFICFWYRPTLPTKFVDNLSATLFYLYSNLLLTFFFWSPINFVVCKSSSLMLAEHGSRYLKNKSAGLLKRKKCTLKYCLSVAVGSPCVRIGSSILVVHVQRIDLNKISTTTQNSETEYVLAYFMQMTQMPWREYKEPKPKILPLK